MINGKKNGIICLKEKKEMGLKCQNSVTAELAHIHFLPISKLTCVSEAMNKTASRFPKIHWMACSSEKKKTSSSFGFIAGLDQRILLLTAFAMHQTNRPRSGGESNWETNQSGVWLTSQTTIERAVYELWSWDHLHVKRLRKYPFPNNAVPCHKATI